MLDERCMCVNEMHQLWLDTKENGLQQCMSHVFFIVSSVITVQHHILILVFMCVRACMCVCLCYLLFS